MGNLTAVLEQWYHAAAEVDKPPCDPTMLPTGGCWIPEDY